MSVTDHIAAEEDSCGRFRDLDPSTLQDGTIHRLVLGEEDEKMRQLSSEDAAAELGDPFATELLLKGTFPRVAGQVLDAFATVRSEGDPLRRPMFFLVGDGSQIPFTPETAAVERNMRFLVTLGNGPEGPEVMLSSFQPDTADVELMAWDAVTGGFNYYQTVGNSTGWVFAGNSRHALAEPTEGKGPFEAHPSGSVVMKELASPWINWDSPAANILPSAFSEDDPLRDHPWFTKKEPQGAITCESAVIRPAIKRWARHRFATIANNGGQIDRPERIMRQILSTPAINLISSHTESAIAAADEKVDLPQTFFVDSVGLSEQLGLQAPPATFDVPGTMYAASMETFAMKLVAPDGTVVRAGDTHFAFVVPQRAAEDQAVLTEAIAAGLLTDRFAACLLMTDFPNPVYSARRAALLAHVPASATISDNASDFSQMMADAIVAAAPGTDEGSGEREFGERWGVGDAWREEFNRLLGGYYQAVSAQLADQSGLDDIVRLAESRRDHVRPIRIAESSLLFAQTNVARAERIMLPNGTVAEEA